MPASLQITYRDVFSVSQVISGRAGKLSRLHPRIISCRVVIWVSHEGRLYSARIDVRMPGHEVVVSRSPASDKFYREIYGAVHHSTP